MNEKIELNVSSEIGELKGVILHTPGKEVENMTPKTAERALYSDILNLSVAKKEYQQLKGVLDKYTNTFQVRDLLIDVLSNKRVKEDLLLDICKNEYALNIIDQLVDLDNETLASSLLEGVVMEKKTLTQYLSSDRYSLQPLHNLFFTRDGSITMRDEVLISKMASKVRAREALIMKAIFDYSSFFSTKTVTPTNSPEITIEGGDVLIAREDIVCIGIGARTTTQGVDFILNEIKKNRGRRHILVQELPYKPESFIHLDMVFTFLDRDHCMVFEPIILRPNRFETVHIIIENGKVISIKNEDNLVVALKDLGMDLKPVLCGGTDPWVQEREQWHSGANFFAMGPGKVIGYGRNVYTIEAMNNSGFEILKAKDIISGKVNMEDYKKFVAIIEGSELSRGGGGCRCMTMPIKRENIEW